MSGGTAEVCMRALVDRLLNGRSFDIDRRAFRIRDESGMILRGRAAHFLWKVRSRGDKAHAEGIVF